VIGGRRRSDLDGMKMPAKPLEARLEAGCRKHFSPCSGERRVRRRDVSRNLLSVGIIKFTEDDVTADWSSVRLSVLA
jgi:hypothetical protein